MIFEYDGLTLSLEPEKIKHRSAQRTILMALHKTGLADDVTIVEYASLMSRLTGADGQAWYPAAFDDETLEAAFAAWLDMPMPLYDGLLSIDQAQRTPKN